MTETFTLTQYHSPAAADRAACQLVAGSRQPDQNVALIRCGDFTFRTVIFTEAETAEAEAMPYDHQSDQDGFQTVASRHLLDGETVISVY